MVIRLPEVIMGTDNRYTKNAFGNQETLRLDLIISPLEKSHVRKSFDCGEQSLNEYLHRYASQDIRRRYNRIFVVSYPSAPQQVIGYYGLSAGNLNVSNLSERLRRRLSKYPVPVVLLGRLAIAESHQGQGLGSILLADALRNIVRASQVVAVYAVVVDASDNRAAGFYRNFGFIPLPSRPLRLFLSMDSIAVLPD